MLRNIIYIIGSILFFFSGIVAYGIILNLREKTLEESLIEKNISHIVNVSIMVDRKNYKLYLISDSTTIKAYNVVFGRNSSPIKLSKNDYATPSGEYNICRVDTSNVYYKKLYLSFPNLRDAAEALRANVITDIEYLEISNSLKGNKCSFSNTQLGADIGIQGIGEYNIIFKNLPFVYNWTNGSIALSNENIDELLSVVPIGTKVTIKN